MTGIFGEIIVFFNRANTEAHGFKAVQLVIHPGNRFTRGLTHSIVSIWSDRVLRPN